MPRELLLKKETEVVIDLEKELSPAELESFRDRSEAEGSEDLTAHFKKVFLEVPERRAS